MRLSLLICVLILSTAFFVESASALPEKLITDHDVYVENEAIHVEIRECRPNSTYLLEARSTVIYNYWYITTNSQGIGYTTIIISDEGKYTLNLRYPAFIGGSIVSQKNVTILPLTFEIEPSKFTGTNTYVPGDSIWTHIIAVPNRSYIVNITFGKREIFSESITTDINGESVLKIDLPEFVDDGDSYKINLLTVNKEHISSLSFNVRSIVINANTEKSIYLLDEVVRVFYSVVWIKNGTKVYDRRNEAVIYLDGGRTDYKEIYYSSGVIEFDLSIYKKHGVITPDNPNPYIITIWYNLSEYPKRFDDISIRFYTGILECSISTQPLSGGYFANSDIEISIKSMALNRWRGKSPVSYAKINSIKIEKSEHWIETELPIDNIPEKTGYNGRVSIIYHLPRNLNVSTKIIISANISVGSEYAVGSHTFRIESGANIKIEFDKTRYLAGDIMTVRLELQNFEGVGEPISYSLEVYTEEKVLMYFADSSESLFKVNIPADMRGLLEVVAKVRTMNGYTFSAISFVEVSYAYLYVVLSKTLYLPGDEIKVSAQVESRVMGPSFIYNFVIYADGLFMKNITTASSEITFVVPSENPPSNYKIQVSATSRNYVVRGEALTSLYNGYIVEVYVETPSAYTTRVYTPGQKVFFYYKIKVSGKVHSSIALLHFYIPNTNYEWYKYLESLEGKVSIVIPNDLSGLQDVVFEVISKYPCIPSKASIYVDRSPPWGEVNVGGISVMDLILLLLVIFAIVIGILSFRRIIRPSQEKVVEERRKGPRPWSEEKKKEAEISAEKSQRQEDRSSEKKIEEIREKKTVEVGEIRDEL